MNLDRILANHDIREELATRLDSEEGYQDLHWKPLDREALVSRIESMVMGRAASKQLEAMVRRFGRPVLFIQQNRVAEPKSELWRGKIEAARARLEAVLPSIGRIEVHNHPSRQLLGTGWLVAPDVLVTCRHVAVEFGRRSDSGFVFKHNPAGETMRACIDFRAEYDQPGENVFQVCEILHIEEDDDVSPDIAFLRVASLGEEGQGLPLPVSLSSVDPEPDRTVGIIGCAIRDGGCNDEDVMERVFQNTYNVKRLHPGEVITVGESVFNHDCTTLGGNSGSPVIDFATGEAVGIHFAGSFERENYAVKASIIRRRMAEIGIGQVSAEGLDTEIEALYRRIDTLTQAKKADRDAEVEGEVAGVLARLRRLQKAEAVRFREELEARLAMPVDAGEKILGRAKALREKLEGLTASNPAAD